MLKIDLHTNLESILNTLKEKIEGELIMKAYLEKTIDTKQKTKENIDRLESEFSNKINIEFEKYTELEQQNIKLNEINENLIKENEKLHQTDEKNKELAQKIIILETKLEISNKELENSKNILQKTNDAKNPINYENLLKEFEILKKQNSELLIKNEELIKNHTKQIHKNSILAQKNTTLSEKNTFLSENNTLLWKEKAEYSFLFSQLLSSSTMISLAPQLEKIISILRNEHGKLQKIKGECDFENLEGSNEKSKINDLLVLDHMVNCKIMSIKYINELLDLKREIQIIARNFKRFYKKLIPVIGYEQENLLKALFELIKYYNLSEEYKDFEIIKINSLEDMKKVLT